ncbi:MAG: outer membrane protein assembly factor BamA [Candidatus Binatia bacterium]|nr:outer membrane protein assembly factor BamA [Candidatus Binatia bacterium]
MKTRRSLTVLGVVLVLCLGLLAFAGEAAAQAFPRVKSITIADNTRVDEHAIRVHIASKAGVPINLPQLDADLRSVYGMGFFDDVQIEVEQTPGANQVDVIFRVVERPLIRDVTINGDSEVKEEELEEALGVRGRTIYDPEKVRRGVEQARGLFEKEGYLDVTITPEVQPTGTGDVDLVYQIEQGEAIRVGEILFEGNENFSDRELKAIMATKEAWFLSWIFDSGTLNREDLKTDMERVTAFYFDHGYVNVKLGKPEVTRDGNELIITTKVEEGEPYDFGEIRFAGDYQEDILTVENLQKSIEAQQGDVFRSSLLRTDVERLTDIYGDLGYAFTNVEPETLIRPDEKKVDVTFRVSKGAPVSIGKIEITGNTKTRDKVLRREMKINEQEKFSATNLRRSRDALQRLGFFSEVNVTTRKANAPDQINVLVDLKEGSTGSFSAGAGFSSADSFLFNVRVSENNFLGRGLRVVANADIGSVRRNIFLSATDPYFLDTNLLMTGTLFTAQLQFPDFTREALGLSIRALYPFEALDIDRVQLLPWTPPISLQDTRFGVEYRLERAKISDIAPDAPPSIFAAEGSTFISSIAPGILRNTLNHAFDPTDGSYQDFSFEFAGLGGETRFLKFSGRGRWFVPIYRIPGIGPLVFSSGGRVAWGLGEEGISGKEIPLIDRYFPGGINTVRGYEIRSLGPRESTFSPQGAEINNQPVGGTNQLIVQTEVIFPLFQEVGLRGVAFFDLGNAWLQEDGIDVGNLRYSTGLGIRWLSPFGPLRIEFGVPLNPKENEEKQPIQFSFGAPL